MSTIQNLKNFIRHGKQARANNAVVADPTTNVSPVHAQQQQNRHHNYGSAPHRDHYATSEPNVMHPPPPNAAQIPAGYSVANVDQRNVAAQAGGAAAKATGDKQRLQDEAAETKSKGYDPAVVERMVAEERESKGKLPRYPGLERWTLMEKMGDGAFSNVYRAKDNTGKLGEVAIKVVRKFEMNANQVCLENATVTLFPALVPCFIARICRCCALLPTRSRPSRTTIIYIPTSRSKQRSLRCALLISSCFAVHCPRSSEPCITRDVCDRG